MCSTVIASDRPCPKSRSGPQLSFNWKTETVSVAAENKILPREWGQGKVEEGVRGVNQVKNPACLFISVLRYIHVLIPS